MKQITIGLLAAAFALPALVSCSDESPWHGSEDEGAIALDFNTDGRVMRQTRADDNASPIVPAKESFAINLAKSDGSLNKDWASLEAFNREKAFPIGDYTLTASYGDIDREGFTSPYYRGSADLHVSPGSTAEVSVTATLANAMVSVRYTDAFISNFPRYSAAVQTEGHDWVAFAQGETRPAYVAPSEVKLDLTLTNNAGQQVTIQPASFQTLARHHYIVTIGVTGDSSQGTLALDVQFDDEVVNETVSVPLGDELFSAPAPTVTAKGFVPGVSLETFEYASGSDNPEFHVFSFAGLAKANLTVAAAGNASFGGSYQLVNADSKVQQQLEASGFDCAGFFTKPDKMAVVNAKAFLAKVPAGNYTVTLEAVDAMTRVSEPVRLDVSVTEVVLEFAGTPSVGFMAGELQVDMATNCPGVLGNIAFKAPDAHNRMVPAEVKSIVKVEAPQGGPARSAGVETYRFTLAVEPQLRAALTVEATLGNKELTASVPMEAPDYTIVTDAFSNRVMVKVEAATPELTKAVVDNLSFVNAGTPVPTSNVAYDDASGIVTVKGLSPATEYVALTAKCGTFEKTVPEFTTEATTDLANGNFGQLKNMVSISPVQVGGKYKVSPVSYTIKSSIEYQEPAGWATVNENTCWTGSSNHNTWFLVPSTFMQSGLAVLRSVGYSHNGTTPATSGGAANTKYYCENSPSDSELDKAAGELFLGSYSYDGSAHRTDGIAFSTRPASLSFDYSYESVNNEQGEAFVELLDASGAVIATKTVLLGVTSSVQSKTVALGDYPFGKKCVKIKVGFKSTKTGVTPAVNIPTGKALSEGTGLGNKTIAANSYHALATGSKLTLSNIKLNY